MPKFTQEETKDLINYWYQYADGKFSDPELMSQTWEGISLLLERGVELTKAEAVADAMGFPEDTIAHYEEFLKFLKGEQHDNEQVEDFSELMTDRNQIARILADTAIASDNFHISFKA